jgi:hypothetical protein
VTLAEIEAERDRLRDLTRKILEHAQRHPEHPEFADAGAVLFLLAECPLLHIVLDKELETFEGDGEA